MMKKNKKKLTLHRPAFYRIKVPGHLDESWADWTDGMMVIACIEEDSLQVTTLTGTMDQAALQGLLRRLYSLGLPLISVNYIQEDCQGN